MSQDKAASLTSSLFARKGRASPASLVIAGLPEAAVPDPAIEAPVDLHEAHDGAPMKRSALELKGQPRRKGAKGSEGELPLLAFVEAQVAAEGQRQEAAAGAPDEPSPAASLLERGCAGLRRANGRVLDDPPAEVVRAAVVSDDETPAPEDQATGEDDEAPVEETVSGDTNVTAIEDAPADKTETEPEAASASDTPEIENLEHEVVEAVAAEDAAEAMAPVADTAVQATADAAAEPVAGQEVPAPSAELKAASDAAIAATLALRQATAQRAATSQTTERPAPSYTASPARGSATLWRSAAAVALGAALGLGAYAYLSGGETSEPAQQAAAPVVEPLTEAPAEATPPEAQAAVPLETAAAAPASAPQPALPETAPQETAAVLPEPSFDIIRIEPDGQSIIAGRALPFSEWILLNNGEPIASIKADINGEWVVLPDASLVPGANAFSLVPKTERGKVAIPAPAAAEPAAVPVEPAPPSGPRAEALPPGSPPSSAMALPLAKPQAPAPAVFRAAAGGGYEVQLASVRQSAEAERELRRLASAFPGLLGALDLRVQEASVDGAGTFYRVRSGALAHLGEAREVCRLLEGQGQGCLVVKRVAVAAPAEPLDSDAAGDSGQEPHDPPRQQAERP